MALLIRISRRAAARRRARISRIGATVWLVLALALAHATSARAADGAASEYAVKAAFLYNFAQLTRWPETAFPGPKAPLTVCVLEPDPFGAALDALVGEKVQERLIAVRRVTTSDEGAACHVLFVAEAGPDRLHSLTEGLGGRPVLTVGDGRGFLGAGGIIRLFQADGRVRFAVNHGAAERAGLELSSRLLKLAQPDPDR